MEDGSEAAFLAALASGDLHEAEKQARAAAETQRGEPESKMLRFQKAMHNIAPSVIHNLAEHIGDLAHRAQKQEALPNVAEKLEIVERMDGVSRWTPEKEIEEGYRQMAEEAEMETRPDLMEMMAMRGKPGGPKGAYEVYEKVRRENSAGIEARIAAAKSKVSEALKGYVDAHERENKPVTQLGQLGKDAAIKLGRQDFDGLRKTVATMRAWLDDYATLDDDAKMRKLLTPR